MSRRNKMENPQITQITQIFFRYGLANVWRQLKALTKVGEIEWAQVLNGHERGLLINFGAKSLERRRFIRSHDGAQRI
jgi:hypothetical protein